MPTFHIPQQLWEYGDTVGPDPVKHDMDWEFTAEMQTFSRVDFSNIEPGDTYALLDRMTLDQPFLRRVFALIVDKTAVIYDEDGDILDEPGNGTPGGLQMLLRGEEGNEQSFEAECDADGMQYYSVPQISSESPIAAAKRPRSVDERTLMKEQRSGRGLFGEEGSQTQSGQPEVGTDPIGTGPFGSVTEAAAVAAAATGEDARACAGSPGAAAAADAADESSSAPGGIPSTELAMVTRDTDAGGETGTNASNHTASGMGTSGWLSPEQLAGTIRDRFKMGARVRLPPPGADVPSAATVGLLMEKALDPEKASALVIWDASQHYRYLLTHSFMSSLNPDVFIDDIDDVPCIDRAAYLYIARCQKAAEGYFFGTGSFMGKEQCFQAPDRYQAVHCATKEVRYPVSFGVGSHVQYLDEPEKFVLITFLIASEPSQVRFYALLGDERSLEISSELRPRYRVVHLTNADKEAVLTVLPDGSRADSGDSPSPPLPSCSLEVGFPTHSTPPHHPPPRQPHAPRPMCTHAGSSFERPWEGPLVGDFGGGDYACSPPSPTRTDSTHTPSPASTLFQRATFSSPPLPP